MALISESLEVFMDLFNDKSLFKFYKLIEDYLEAIYFSDMIDYISFYTGGKNLEGFRMGFGDIISKNDRTI